MNIKLHGRSLIGFSEADSADQHFKATNPATLEPLSPDFFVALSADVDQAVSLASDAFPVFSKLSYGKRAAFLRAIAANIEAAIEAIVPRMTQESALPEARARMEAGRTIGQIRLFARHLEEGSWVDARIETAIPDRTPVPKPDVRSMRIPIGAVAVFGASNFPLAFSVAGGDTIAALAAGCPVIHKAHPSHPGTCEIVGRQIIAAAQSSGMPEGVFSLLFDSGHSVGQALVKHPKIKAIAFTGSRKGGRALFDIAVARPEPIPVYAEMGSVNPFIIFPGALRENGREIAEGLASSITLGCGQFCTKPGIIFYDGNTSFREHLIAKLKQSAPAIMLNADIARAFSHGVQKLSAASSVAAHLESEHGEGNRRSAFLYESDVKTFISQPELAHEVFGPVALLVRYDSYDELLAAVTGMEGQITATLHAVQDELVTASTLITALENKVGRLLFGGYPTGVDVNHAMVHGGPYPATSDGRGTSVGTLSMNRFTRLIAYQNCADALLPDPLKDANPLGYMRFVNGQFTRDPITR